MIDDLTLNEAPVEPVEPEPTLEPAPEAPAVAAPAPVAREPLTVWLHCGPFKTGSTALQTILAEKSEWLAERGADYPVRPEDMEFWVHRRPGNRPVVQGGNFDVVSRYVVERLEAGELPEAEGAAKALTSLTETLGRAPGRSLILSSENAATLDPVLIRDAVIAAFPDRDVTVRPVFVIRDLLDHAVSLWAHQVRYRALTTPLADYVMSPEGTVQLETLKAYASVFGEEAVVVIRYRRADSVAKDLISLTPAKGFVSPELGARVVNGSLSVAACEALQKVAAYVPAGSWVLASSGARLGNELYSAVAEALADEEAEADRAALPVDKALRDAFAERFADDLTWLNTRFDPIGGDVGVTAKGRKGQPAKEHARRVAEAFDRALALALRQCALADGQSFPHLKTRLETHDLVRKAGVFDAAHYRAQIAAKFEGLPFGADLAEGDELQHYLQFGEKRGLSPCPYFDPVFYRRYHADLFEAEPLLHYVREGAREGRAPHPDVPESLAAEYRHVGNLVALLLGQAQEDARARFARLTGREA